MSYDLFSVGDNVADYYPEEEKVYAGGSAYNVAVIAKRLGAKTAYYGTFGVDENAKFLHNSLKKEKVAYPVSDIRKGRNAVSIIEKENGISEVKAVDKGVYKGLDINQNVLKLIKDSKIVHSNIYGYFEDYLSKLHYQTRLSFDFSFLRNKDYIKEIIRKIDIAFFAESKNNEDPEKFLQWVSNLGVEIAVITLAEKGALMAVGDEIFYKEALETEVVDTLGAGDAFIAGFLSSLVKAEKNYNKALNSALETASKYCRINGSLGVSEKRTEAVKIHKNIHE